MDEYKQPYLALFSSVTRALEAIRKRNYGEAEKELIEGQQRAEELFIAWEGPGEDKPDALK